MKYNSDKVLDTFEQECRNNVIAHLFTYMKDVGISYSERIEYLTSNFHLSDKRIEEIIRGYKTK